MDAYHILLKAGYSHEEALKISSGSKKISQESCLSVADANERKYAKVGPSAIDRIKDKFAENQVRTYDDISLRHTCGVGDCTTNKGVIRRIKYGKGNISKRGYLAMPFEGRK